MHHDSTRRIPLTKGAYALVDAADYPVLAVVRWHCGSTGYACRRLGKAGRIVMMHRLLMGLDGQPRSGGVVDHINRNRLDNRRANLRVVSWSDNARNRANGEGRLPVGVFACGEAWGARINHQGRRFHLGHYPTPALAAAAREAAFTQLLEGTFPFDLHRRGRRGEHNPAAKLTPVEVRAIRAAYADGERRLTWLGRQYGVTGENVWLIVRRKKWVHLP